MSLACLFVTAAGLGFPPLVCLSTGVRRFAHDHIDPMTDPKPRGTDAYGITLVKILILQGSGHGRETKGYD